MYFLFLKMFDVEFQNPWAVTSIGSFNFLCCPECVYRSKEESSFQIHAIKNHPKSKTFFAPDQLLKELETDANLYFRCPQCSFRNKNVNTFQLHALENHPLSVDFFMENNKNEKSSEFIPTNLNTYITLPVQNCLNFLNIFRHAKGIAKKSMA